VGLGLLLDFARYHFYHALENVAEGLLVSIRRRDGGLRSPCPMALHVGVCAHLEVVVVLPRRWQP
jgi:hypothetical protein